MEVSFDEAVAIFESEFGNSLKSPYLHPSYVSADAKRDPAVSPVFFVFRREAHVFYHAFHLARIPEQSLNDIQSAYGYGGPIANTNDEEFLAQAWLNFREWCTQHAVLAEFVRFHPLIDNSRFFGGETFIDRETVWIDLTQPDLLASYSVRARTAIRKAQKHALNVEWWPARNFVDIFPQLYLAHMRALDANEYYFFPADYFESLAALPYAHLAVCKINEEIVAAAIFLVGPQHLEYHLSAATMLGKQLCATNLLIHEAAQHGKNLGCKAMHLGGGTNSDPSNPLLFFKSGFSALRATFRIGKFVHSPEKYEALKTAWVQEHKRSTARILFYR